MRILYGSPRSSPQIAGWFCFALRQRFLRTITFRRCFVSCARTLPDTYACIPSRSRAGFLYTDEHRRLHHLIFYRVQSFSSRSSCLLCLTLLLHQHLLPKNLLNHPQIVRLAVDHILQLLDVARELLDLAVVESEGIVGGLFHVETSTDVDEDVACACELAGDV